MRQRLLNLEAPVWVVLGRVADIVWLNVLFLVCSLPVVTIGAALTALHDAARRVLAESDSGVTAAFFAAFRANVRDATLLWLVVGPVGAVIVAAWIWLPQTELIVVKILVSVVYALVFPFVWAVQARLENTVGRTLVNAVVVTFASLGYAVAVLAVDLALAGLTVFVLLTLPQGVFLLLMLGYPLAVFAHTPLLERGMRPLLERAASGPEGLA